MGSDHSPLPHVASRRRLLARLGLAQARRGWFLASRPGGVRSVMFKLGSARGLCGPSYPTCVTLPGLEFFELTFLSAAFVARRSARREKQHGGDRDRNDRIS